MTRGRERGADQSFAGLVVAGSVVCAVVAAVVVLPLMMRAFQPARETSPPVPWDMYPYLMDECMEVIPESERYTTVVPLETRLDGDGRVRTVMGSVTMEVRDTGEVVTTSQPVIDPVSTASVNECLGARTFEQAPAYREPTEGERLVLLDWVRRVQEPCLRSRGIAMNSPSYAALMQPSQHLWRMPDMPGADFETRLEVRLACPPMPEFLHADGIYGY